MSEFLHKFGEFTITTSISWLNPLGPGHPTSPVSIEQLRAEPALGTVVARVRNLNVIHLLTKARLVTIFDQALDPVEAHRRTPVLRIQKKGSSSHFLSGFEDEARNSGTVVLDPEGSCDMTISFGDPRDADIPVRLCLQLAAMPASEPTSCPEAAGGAPA